MDNRAGVHGTRWTCAQAARPRFRVGENEYLISRGSKELITASGFREGGNAVKVDGEGFLDLGEKRGVYQLSTWLWLDPEKKGKEVWDPRFPEPKTGDVSIPGGFRGGRITSIGFGGQLNPYRMWMNGDVMPVSSRPGEPRANTDYGPGGDSWRGLPLKKAGTT